MLAVGCEASHKKTPRRSPYGWVSLLVSPSAEVPSAAPPTCEIADKKGGRYPSQNDSGLNPVRISSNEKMHKLALALALGAAATVDVTADVKAWHAAELENGRRVLSTAHHAAPNEHVRPAAERIVGGAEARPSTKTSVIGRWTASGIWAGCSGTPRPSNRTSAGAWTTT